MNILVVGAGIIGAIYGWALSQAGHPVTHLVRKGKAGRFAPGVPIDMLDGRKGRQKRSAGLYRIKVIEALPTSDSFGLVIVPTKPYQVEEALRQIAPQVDTTAYLLLTQNWPGTDGVDAILSQSNYLYGDAKAGGVFKDGTLIAALFPSIDLGTVHPGHKDLLDPVAALFQSVGISPTIQDNILHYIWVQYAVNAGFWPALARAGGLEKLLGNRPLGDLSLRAVKECLDVVAARGVDLEKYPDTRMFYSTSSLKRRLAGLGITLMFRFNESVRRTSAHALGDPIEVKTAYYEVLNTGRELDVPMPVMSSFEPDIVRLGETREIAAG